MIRKRHNRVFPTGLLAALAAISAAPLSGAAATADPAPDFTLVDTYGQPVSIKSYRGAVVWLTFGATW